MRDAIKTTRSLAVPLVAALTVACSGGVTGDAYNTAASVGDLLTYTLDTDSLQYTYEVVAGDELANKTGSGTLTAVDGYGDYVFEAEGGATVILFPNRFVAVGLANGEGALAGVPAIEADYDATTIAGVFNHVTLSRAGAGVEGSYGSFELFADGTWSSYYQAQVGGTPTSTGTWEDQGNGVVEVSTGEGKIGHAMFLPGSTSGEVMVVDLDNAEERGIMVAQRQRSLTAGELDGVYDVLDTSADGIYTADVNGTSVEVGGEPLAMQFDVPWEGFVTVEDGSLVLVTADGIFFGGGSGYVMVGARQ